MLIKQRPRVNFINILCSAFTSADPKSSKGYWQHNWIFMLLGSAGVRAAHKLVGEIDPCTLKLIGFLDRKNRKQS